MKSQIHTTAVLLLLSSFSMSQPERGLAAPAAANVQPAPSREQLAFFESKIRPVLVERCYECHSTEAKKIKGGLVLDSREGWMKGGDTGTAVVPGDPEKSLLIQAIRYLDEDLQMPPKAKDQLSSKQVADFEEWVRMGAPDPRTQQKAVAATKSDPLREGRDFWSFKPV